MALAAAMKERHGKKAMPRDGYTSLSLEIGAGKTQQVLWGTYSLSKNGETVGCETNSMNNRVVFQLHYVTKIGSRQVRDALTARIRDLAMTKSVYKGRAVTVTLPSPNSFFPGVPEFKFLELPKDPVKVILNKEIEEDLAIGVFEVLKNTDQIRASGSSLKRGYLLAGDFGTGKTMTAAEMAQVSTKNGWTFFYVLEPSQFVETLRFATRFQPAVVFCEDIERLAGPERTDRVNNLINTLDGIDNKTAEIVTVFTTNNPNLINKAMLRPGRVDFAIIFEHPNEETVKRLLLHYGNGLLAENVNLERAITMLAGHNPAVVREAIERAKFAMINKGMANQPIGSDELTYGARAAVKQHQVFAAAAKPPQEPHPLSRFGEAVGQELGKALKGNGSAHPSKAQ